MRSAAWRGPPPRVPPPRPPLHLRRGRPARPDNGSDMQERLDEIERSYEELTRELSAPEVASDHARFRDLGKRHRELEEIVTVGRQWRKALGDSEDARVLAREEKDPETEAYFRQEAERAQHQAAELERRLELLLLPKDPNDDKD